MERIRRRSTWFILIFIAGLSAVLIGKFWLFKDAACPKFQDLILYGSAGLLVLMMLLNALITRNDAPVRQLLSLLLIVGGALLFAAIAGSYLSDKPQVQVVFCAPEGCDQAVMARGMRGESKLDGALEVAKHCVETASGFTSPEESSSCKQACGEELAMALFEKSGQLLKSLPKEWDNSKALDCQIIQSQLEEALEVAERFGHEKIAISIIERQARALASCVAPEPTATPTLTSVPTSTYTPTPTLTPSPTPTPNILVEVLRKQLKQDQALLDIRIFEDSEFRKGMQPGDFMLTASETLITFEFEERESDDPVCLIAVVDDSGSISPGLTQIRDGISTLNELRKPEDELGMVLFSDHDSVQIIESPSRSDLNPRKVQGAGSKTALWDGVLQGLDAAKLCKSEQRYLLVLTDGDDNDSRFKEGDPLTTARKVAEIAASQGVDVCAVGVESSVLNPDALSQAAYGCGYYPAQNFDILASLFQELFGYVREFYRFTFQSDSILDDGQVLLRVLDYLEVPVDYNEP